MLLDRELQRRILKGLAEIYPSAAQSLLKDLSADTDAGIANLVYLREHGMVSGELVRLQSHIRPGKQKITAKGLDFLADDGGLSAILGVVTVRLHQDTIRLLVTQKIEDSDLPEEEKRPLLQAVRELPGEAIKHLTTKLLDLGMDNLPGAVALIRTTLQSASGS